MLWHQTYSVYVARTAEVSSSATTTCVLCFRGCPGASDQHAGAETRAGSAKNKARRRFSTKLAVTFTKPSTNAKV